MKKLTKVTSTFFLAFLLLLSSCDPTVDPTDTNTTTDTTSDTTTDIDDDKTYPDYYNNYYQNLVSWENGEDLKEQLHEIVNDNVYLIDFDTSSRKWEPNQLADETFDNFDRVNLVYASYQPLKTHTFTPMDKGWQREHAFAQSLGNYDVSSTRPDTEKDLIKDMKSDYHNLFASDGSINNSRGNKNLGNVDELMGEIYYPTDDHGNETGVRAIRSTSEDDSVMIFEPRAEDKGMLARAIFYMATRFEDLSVIEGISEVRSKSHGMLSDLLTWSLDDVSLREYKHNIGVYHFQNNRNPYVDFPELVNYVFGSKQNESGTLEKIKPAYYDLVLEGETKDVKDERNLAVRDVKVTYQVGEAFSKNKDLKAFTVNQDLSVNLALNINDFTTSPNDGYEFRASDVGFKLIKVNYLEFEVTYEVEIESDPSLRAIYQYELTNDDPFAGLRNNDAAAGVTHLLNLGGMNFNFYFQSGVVYNFQASSGLGRQFGTGTKPVRNLYLETADEFIFDSKNNVDGIYIVASTATKNTNQKVQVSIGSYTFSAVNMEVGPANNNTLYSFRLNEGITYQGKVKISFSNFSEGALYIKRFAINAT